MNRREFVAGSALLVSSAPALGVSADLSDKEKQYEICKVRGHIRTIPGSGNFSVNTAVWAQIPDSPARPYQDRSETPWETCFYCGKQFRFVTTIEEK